MPRYAAFLRGVSPVNAKMPDLKRCFEAAGFTDVKTLLSSGNVVFSAGASSDAALERKAEIAMKKQLGREFLTIVRSLDALRAILASDPYRAFRLSPGAKRVVTFLRNPPRAKLGLPIELDGARILDAEVHRRLRDTGSHELLELLRRRGLLHAARRDHDDPDHELAFGVLCQQQESSPRGDVEERLMARRVQDALGTCSPEAPDPGQRAK